jgi:hypothetical protein
VGTGFFVDPMTGIAVVFGVQVLVAPTGDVEVRKEARKYSLPRFEGRRGLINFEI